MAQNMENWRLSRIEEELERLDIAPVDMIDGDDFDDLPPPPMLEPEPEQDIYSKIVILPAYKKNAAEDETKEGVKKITEKYDSLGRMKPFIENNLYTADGSKEELSTTTVEPPEGYAQQAHESGLASTAEAYYAQQDKILSEAEILQVEMFYRSHKTEVFVCSCAAHMYFGSVVKTSPTQSPVHPPNAEKWTFVKSGIPVLVLDSGDSRRNRRLNLVLAEKGTGFVLWKDAINHLTNYKVIQPTFHTMHLSNDHTKMAGLNFDDNGAATDFIQRFHALTSDPKDDILNLSGSRKKKKDDKRKKGKYKAPNKADISSPCCFTHVTKLERSDGMNILGSSAPNSPQISREHRPSLKKLSPIKMPKLSTMVPSYDS